MRPSPYSFNLEKYDFTGFCHVYIIQGAYETQQGFHRADFENS